jgi:hypothetical protein
LRWYEKCSSTLGMDPQPVYDESGWKNKLQSAIANVTPAGLLAEQHRKMAEPGSGQHAND